MLKKPKKKSYFAKLSAKLWRRKWPYKPTGATQRRIDQYDRE